MHVATVTAYPWDVLDKDMKVRFWRQLRRIRVS